MKRCVTILGLLFLPVGVSDAQTVVGASSRLDGGTRIRITDPARGTRREGVFMEWRADSAIARIDASGDIVVVPPALVNQLEVYDGTRSGSRKGAIIGGSVGFGAAVFVLIVASADPYLEAPSTGQAIAGVALNTALYAGIGALIGSAIKKPRWRSIDSAPRLQAMVDPRGRVGLGVSIGF